MAFNPNPPKAEYQATAGQTNFPFLFKIYFTSDIKVYHTPISTGTTVLLTEGVDYSVVINGDDGGTVTLILVVENNDYIVLERELELTRYVEYQTSGDLLAGTLNADQDYQTYLVSDQNALRDNSLYLPNGTFGVDTELPFPIAGYFFKWSADGKSVEYGAPSTVAVPWGNITGTLSDQTDLQTALNLKADISYVDTEDAKKLNIANPTYTGTLTGEDVVTTGTTQMLDRFIWETNGAAGLQLRNFGSGVIPMYISLSALPLNLASSGLYYNSKKVVVEDAYATDAVGGTIKILVSGTDCYITTDNSTPGP